MARILKQDAKNKAARKKARKERAECKKLRIAAGVYVGRKKGKSNTKAAIYARKRRRAIKAGTWKVKAIYPRTRASYNRLIRTRAKKAGTWRRKAIYPRTKAAYNRLKSRRQLVPYTGSTALVTY
jgi:hypothetical protein